MSVKAKYEKNAFGKLANSNWEQKEMKSLTEAVGSIFQYYFGKWAVLLTTEKKEKLVWKSAKKMDLFPEYAVLVHFSQKKKIVNIKYDFLIFKKL